MTARRAEEVAMFGAERRQLILELVRARGSVSMAELAKVANVSEVTARRDVNALESRGLLVRRHGGAMVPGGDEPVAPPGPEQPPMFGAARRRLILNLVRANQAVSLAELAWAANVSEMTVRRDLTALEHRGLLVRAHGGAIAADALKTEVLGRKPVLYEPADDPAAGAKAAIAQLAASMTGGDEAIMLGSGSTVLELARRLAPASRLTVLTNSMPVARALAHTPHVELSVATGQLDGPSLALVGSSTEQWIAGHRVGRAFVSGTGLTADRGLSSAHLGLSGVDRAMVGSAREVVVLADHSKVGVDTTYQVAPIGRIDHLVTDPSSSGDVLEHLTAMGVNVHVTS